MPGASRNEPSRRAWDAAALRDPHAQPDKADRVEAMFNAIARTYERVNTVATLGRDAAWRRKTVAAAEVRAGDVVLDLCCGTGDMLRVFDGFRPPPRLLLGIDFAAGMLAQAQLSGVRAPWQLIRADALRVPLADESVDVISCAFGVRNFRDLQTGFREMFRVARPGARLVILEFATPENAALRRLYEVYCNSVLPWLGALVSCDRGGAYRYLPRSIQTFETTRTMVRRLEAEGFGQVRLRSLNFGGVVLYRAVKP